MAYFLQISTSQSMIDGEWYQDVIALDDNGELYRLRGDGGEYEDEWTKLPPHPSRTGVIKLKEE